MKYLVFVGYKGINPKEIEDAKIASDLTEVHDLVTNLDNEDDADEMVYVAEIKTMYKWDIPSNVNKELIELT